MAKRTEQCILDAFNRLLTQYCYDDITVGMIAEETGVGLATFYRYFKNKRQAMYCNYKNLLDSYAQFEHCANYRDLYFHMCQLDRPGWSRIKQAFDSTGTDAFRAFIHTYSYETALEITQKHRDGQGFTEVEALQVKMFCFGIGHIYEEWILGRYDVTAEVAANALYVMMPDSLKYSFHTGEKV